MFKTVIILVSLISSNGQILDSGRREYVMPSWDMCIEAVENAKMQEAPSKDGDTLIGQLFCATKQIPAESDQIKAIDAFLNDPNANPYRKSK